MKAIRIHEHGGAEALRYEEVPVPEINDNQLLIKVYAVSVNHLDLKKASMPGEGFYAIDRPWIPGCDFAGTVEKTGKNVTGFSPGDKVYGNCNGGSYAEYLAANPSTVVKIPENVGFTEAASVPHVAETAWQAIHIHGQLQKGQKVLIHGAAGAVGAYAVQFAREIEAEIYVSVAGEDRQYIIDRGAGMVIDYRTTDFTMVATDMDLVLVLVGGDIQKRSYDVLKKGGRLVSTTGPILEDIAREHQVTGIAMVIKQSGEDLKKITALIAAGKVKPDVAVTYPLEEAAKGWKQLSGDASFPHITHGKIVLQVVKE